ASNSGQQIGHTEANDDGHQGRDELETAHQILCILHAAELSALWQRKSSDKWPGMRERVSRAWAGFERSGKRIAQRTGRHGGDLPQHKAQCDCASGLELRDVRLSPALSSS